jgi:GNAT superfamily N-acetyltransferase
MADVPHTTLRRLRPDEVDLGHGILVGAADWLTARGIRQWTADYSKDQYLASQEKGWNFALEYDGQVAAILTLSRELPPHWGQHFAAPVCWLSKVATAPAFRGRGLGRLAVLKAIGHAYDQEVEQLCLDCVHGSGFLVDFYRGMGFRPIDRQHVEFSTGVFDMVLMELILVQVCAAE